MPGKGERYDPDSEVDTIFVEAGVFMEKGFLCRRCIGLGNQKSTYNQALAFHVFGHHVFFLAP